MNKYFTIAILTISIIISSCKKDPGFGGLGEISGKVYAYDYTPSGNLEAESYAPDIKVFISIIGKDGVLDKVDTDLNGTYSFHGLRKGKYIVWTYTECDNCVGNVKPVSKEIELKNNNDDVQVDDLIIEM